MERAESAVQSAAEVRIVGPPGEGKHDSIRLIDAPLSNFPLASAEVDDEVSVDGKDCGKSSS